MAPFVTFLGNIFSVRSPLYAANPPKKTYVKTLAKCYKRNKKKEGEELYSPHGFEIDKGYSKFKAVIPYFNAKCEK